GSSVFDRLVSDPSSRCKPGWTSDRIARIASDCEVISVIVLTRSPARLGTGLGTRGGYSPTAADSNYLQKRHEDRRGTARSRRRTPARCAARACWPAAN